MKINFAMIHTDRRRSKDLYSQNKDLQQLKLRKQSMLRKNRPIIRQGDHPNEEENIILSNGIQTARIRNGHVIGDDEADDDEDAILESDSELHSIDGLDSHGLGGTYDAVDSEDEEEIPVLYREQLITLVGNVRGRSAIILDDMIDRPGSFISAAEHLVQNCGAKKVYVVATHGIFTGDCLEELEKSDAIDTIVVTNTYPISGERIAGSKKFVTIDVSPIFAECIRRDHYGESISVLFDSLAAL